MKRYQNNILVSGTVTLNQLYNALRRVGVTPLTPLTDMYVLLQKKQSESMYLPIEVRGKKQRYCFNSYLTINLDRCICISYRAIQGN